MILVLLAIVIAVPIGLARGGSIRRLAAVNFRWIPVLAVALFIDIAIRFAVSNPGPALKVGVTVGTFALALVFVLANWDLGGMRVVAVGLLLNLTVIIANGAMPVRPSAARAVGAPIADLNDGLRHEVLGSHTLLPWLADLFPLPLIGLVFSVGDVILAAGIGLLVVAQMTAAREAPRPAKRSVSG